MSCCSPRQARRRCRGRRGASRRGVHHAHRNHRRRRRTGGHRLRRPGGGHGSPRVRSFQVMNEPSPPVWAPAAPVSAPAGVANTAQPGWRFMLSHPAHGVALGFGSGLLRPGPGTWGTLAGWMAFVALDGWLTAIGWAVVIVGVFLLGAACAQRTGIALGRPDHGAIVIDEIVAIWIVLLMRAPDADLAGHRRRLLPTVRHREAAADTRARSTLEKWAGCDGRRPARRALRVDRAGDFDAGIGMRPPGRPKSEFPLGGRARSAKGAP